MLLYLQLISDPEMFKMVDSGIRGGVAMVVNRFARANNKYLGDLYDPSKPTTFILYLDANNLYGWAMSQPLPIRGFKWLTRAEINAIDWKAQTVEQKFGYILEVDMKYPAALHDRHNEFPLAVERLSLSMEMLSETQLKVRSQYKMSRSGKDSKLVPNLMDKTKYVVHYRNLQFYLQQGLILKKVHRVICFEQEPWVAPYIAKNQQLRAAATSEFERDQYKLFNNAIYGKMVENQKKRTDIRLLTDWSACKKLIEKPNCRGFRVFGENLAAVELQKVNGLINKPFEDGFTVLDISKLVMDEYLFMTIFCCSALFLLIKFVYLSTLKSERILSIPSAFHDPRINFEIN